MEESIKKSYIKLVKDDERGTNIFKIRFEKNDFIISYDIDKVDSFIEQKRFKMLSANEIDNNIIESPVFYVEVLDNIILESECVNYTDVDLVDVLLYKEGKNCKENRKK